MPLPAVVRFVAPPVWLMFPLTVRLFDALLVRARFVPRPRWRNRVGGGAAADRDAVAGTDGQRVAAADADRGRGVECQAVDRKVFAQSSVGGIRPAGGVEEDVARRADLARNVLPSRR